jgi:hypothetical protein
MLDLSFDYVIAPIPYHSGYFAHKAQDWSYQFQLITKEQLVSELILDFDKAVVLPKVVEKLGIHFAYAVTLLDQLMFIPNKPLNESGFINDLFRVFTFLQSEKLLLPHPLARIKYQGKKVLVDGYYRDDPQLLSLFKQYDMNASFKPLSQPSRALTLHSFEGIEDEVSWFFNHVASLIQQGIPTHNILLIDPGMEYRYELERQSTYFGIPLQFPNDQNLYSLPISQWFISQLEQGIELETIWLGQHPFSVNDVELLKQALIKIELVSVPQSLRSEYIRFYFQQTKVTPTRLSQTIKVVGDTYAPDHHVFVMGFSQGRYPKITRGEPGLSEEAKQDYGLINKRQDNEIKRYKMLQLLGRHPNLKISYSVLENGVIKLPSPLAQTLNMKISPTAVAYDQTDYSNQLGLIRKEVYKYLKKRYQYEHPYLASYQKQFPASIESFRYQYKAMPLNLKHSSLRLSYSAINDYYQCGFKYYVSRILKIKPMNEDRFYLHLGTFAHQIFEELGTRLDEFEKRFDQVLASQKELSAKERLLFSHLKTKLYEVCEFNLAHQQVMLSSEVQTEVEMTFNLDEQTSLVGFIDKLILIKDESNNSYVAVVDYKSGEESFDERMLPYGWSLQLPIYAWMLAHHPDYRDKPILGVFIQHILNKGFGKETMTIDNRHYPKSYQLDGVAISDMKQFQYLDKTFQEGSAKFIQGVALKKNGEPKVSKSLKELSDFKRYITVAEAKILEANQKIRAGDFSINPKKIGQKISCQHCSFIDICFRQNRDIQLIDVQESTEETSEDETH